MPKPAAQGAELVAFTETWLSGYPYWGEGWESKLQDWLPVRVRFYDNAILIPSEDTARLCEAAAKANTHVVIGCNEMDSRRGVHTIYNTQLFIERSGRILGRHRKTVPTFVERAVWGNGDGSDLVTYETDIGRIGGLICGEHLMTLIRARMIDQGEDFHIAVFPGAFSIHCGPKLEEPDLEGKFFWGHTSCRAHAMEAGAFVLAACGYFTQKDLPADFPLRDTVNLDYAHGGSQIVAPVGIPLVPPTSGDTIIYADCQADMIKVWKALDRYHGPLRQAGYRPLAIHEKWPSGFCCNVPSKHLRAVQPNTIDEHADRNEVSRQKVEDTVQRLAQGRG